MYLDTSRECRLGAIEHVAAGSNAIGGDREHGQSAEPGRHKPSAPSREADDKA
jgi:hypothetical protein